MEYVHDFKIDPLSIVNKDWNRPFGQEEYMTRYIKDWKSIFNKKTVDIFEESIQRVMIFNKPEDWNETSKGNSVHVDDGEIICAMNVVLPTADNKSLMEWFHTDINHSELVIGSGSNYVARWNGENAWTQDQFKLIHQCRVDNKVTLVRVDIPHRVVVSQSARVCISVRFKEKFTTWSEAVDHVESLFQELRRT